MTDSPSDLLTRDEAAQYLGIPPKTLALWAYQRTGPPYFRIGKHCRYRRAEVDEWLECRRVEQAGRRP